MASRAFHAAVASSRRTPAASPLPSKNTGVWGSSTTVLSNWQWLLRKRADKMRLGQQPPGHQEPVGYDEPDDGKESASVFAGATPYYACTATPYYAAAAEDSAPCRKRGEALTRLRSAVLAVMAWARRGRQRRPLDSCSCVTGTIFGRRRGRVHVALQTDPRASPALMLELAAYSTGALVREMASGLVRLTLECERTPPKQGDHKRRPQQPALVEVTTWRAYCNGRKCGYAVRRDCSAEEWRVLRAVELVSVGAGVIPDDDTVPGTVGDGDMMYMRAKFERVIGSRDSEAFYMVNPDDSGSCGPELSIYLLRV